MNSKTIFIVSLVVLLPLLAIYWYQLSISIAYHQYQMERTLSKAFSGSSEIKDGVTVFGDSEGDIDELLNRYEFHRTRLVELGVFFHSETLLPELNIATGKEKALKLRTEFIEEVRDNFSDHKHYFLARDGVFQVWDAKENQEKWEKFLTELLPSEVK